MKFQPRRLFPASVIGLQESDYDTNIREMLKGAKRLAQLEMDGQSHLFGLKMTDMVWDTRTLAYRRESEVFYMS